MSTDLPPRHVTLIVDEPRGALPPFEVAMPWWQEVGPIIDTARELFGVDLSVIRLLASAHAFPGGPVTYLVSVPPAQRGGLERSGCLDAVSDHLHPDDETNVAHYATAAGIERLVDWAKVSMMETGCTVTETVQIRSWNLSGLWRLRAHTTSGADVTAWLKAVPGFLATEGEFLTALHHTDRVPEPIAHTNGASLLHDVPGRDAYDASAPLLLDAIDALADVQDEADRQIDWTDQAEHADDHVAALRLLRERQAHQLTGDECARLDRLIEEAPDRFAAAGIVRPTLAHGDLHGGNVRVADTFAEAESRLVLLDWADAFYGNPLFDVAAVDSYDMPEPDRLRAVWFERLAHRTPNGSTAAVTEAWNALRPLADSRLAIVYQRFCEHIPRAELGYHERDIIPALRRGLASL